MLKSLAVASLALALLLLTACEAVSAPEAAVHRGTPIGDTGIRVGGTLQTGVSATAR